MNRSLAALAVVLLLAVSGSWAAGAQSETPAPVAETPEIPLQEVMVEGRRYVVDPYDLFACFITERTVRLGTDGRALEAEIAAQCFIRQGEEMTPLAETATRDFGVTAAAEVGQAIISQPQAPAAAPAGEGLDG